MQQPWGRIRSVPPPAPSTGTGAPRRGCGLPTATVGLGHQRPCPQPPEVTLSLSHRCSRPSPGGELRHPQRRGPQCRMWAQWCQWVGWVSPPQQPLQNPAPGTPHITHQSPPHTTWTHLPTLGGGTLRHPPRPSTQPGCPRAGGVSGDTYRCHQGWDDAAAASPLVSCLLAAHGGVPPPEQSRHPKHSPRSGPGAAGGCWAPSPPTLRGRPVKPVQLPQ